MSQERDHEAVVCANVLHELDSPMVPKSYGERSDDYASGKITDPNLLCIHKYTPS